MAWRHPEIELVGAMIESVNQENLELIRTGQISSQDAKLNSITVQCGMILDILNQVLLLLDPQPEGAGEDAAE